jgi:KRAB domain-containing zinc finger protein
MNLLCSVCDYKTNEPNCLRSHMLTHMQERNYSCERCGKAYKSKGALTRHMKRHDGPAFPCTLCGRSYTTKGTLTRHIKRHQNRREFECNLCGFEFFQSEDLRVHQYKVHKILGFQCDMCDAKFRLKADMKQHRVDVHFNKQKEGSAMQGSGA